MPRDKYSDEAERIGNAWVKNARLFCSAYIPSDAFWSIPACLTAGKFVELTMRVKNVRYRKGQADSIGLAFEITPLDDEERPNLPTERVRVTPKY